jgi:hypothetical protein
MRVVFDNGTPRGVAAALTDHIVEEARSRGWDTLGNGALLDAAEAAGFDVFVTTDRNIRYQQNLTGRKIAVVVLDKVRWNLSSVDSPKLLPPSPQQLGAVLLRLRFRLTESGHRRR